MTLRDTPGPPRSAPVRIPPPPPARGKRRGQTSGRGWIGFGAFALGAGLGVAAYQGLEVVAIYFDYWLALLG